MKTRRQFLTGLGVTAALPPILSRTSQALAAENSSNRILVVVELSGGNDGLNTVVPYHSDEYCRVRPTLGVKKDEAIAIEDNAGLHPSLVGFERIYKDGQMAIVEGCGYENPSLSHFSSMSYWHSGVPNGGGKLGWRGRLADANAPRDLPNAIINIASL